jgi:histone deacetylase 6
MEEALQYDSVFLTPQSGTAAGRAATASLALADALASGAIGNGFAVVRPPGHHAEPCSAKGFCVFNNVAAAAARLVAKGERVLIVDWDVHHGNGTQAMFQGVNNPTYMSIHRHDAGTFYPAEKPTASSSASYNPDGKPGASPASAAFVGCGPNGEGHSMNVAWAGGGAGDLEYLAAMDACLLPVARSLEPTCVLVSAGFDAAEGDPLGGCKVTPEGFGLLTSRLVHRVPSAHGRVLLFLEGGYRLNTIPACAAACLDVLVAASDSQAAALAAAAATAAAAPSKSGRCEGKSPPTVLQPSLGPESSCSEARPVGHTAEEAPREALESASDATTDATTVMTDATLDDDSAGPESSSLGEGSEDWNHEQWGGLEDEAWQAGLLSAAVNAILATRDAHRPFWPVLRP